MDYKKVDRIADKIKNPTKRPIKDPEGRAKLDTMTSSKYTPMKKERLFEGTAARIKARIKARKKAIAIAKSKEPGSRLSVPDIERAMQSVQGKRKGGLTGGQKKLDKNNNNRIDAQDFKILKAEKAKGRGMGLQDEKVKPGKVMKAAFGALALGKKMKEKGKLMPLGLGAAMMKKDKMKEILGRSKGGESKSDKVKRAFPKKSPEGRAKIETMLGSKYTPMKKERLFEGDKARRREGLKKLLKNVRKAIPGVGMLDVKITKKSKGGGADTGRMGELRSKIAVAMDRAKKGMGSRPKLKAPERGPMKPMKKMGGGMMQRPMGYSKGTMVMARGCKLGRKKATKLY